MLVIHGDHDLCQPLARAQRLAELLPWPRAAECRDWSARWFESVPYLVPFAPGGFRDPDAIRDRLGYGTGFPLLFAGVGGTAVGRNLLQLVVEGFDRMRVDQPAARMVMVSGRGSNPRRCPMSRGWRSAAICPTCSNTSPAPTPQSYKGDSAPRWSSLRYGGRSFTSRYRAARIGLIPMSGGAPSGTYVCHFVAAQSGLGSR
jgi:hypothetical protein